MKSVKVTNSAQAEANAEVMTIMPLGGGQEVGRSCIILQYQGRSIMLDCGCHPGREGSDGLPFFDSLDNPEEIDLILITHFHIDHCAALPYFTEKTNFKGRVFMTHATKAVMKLLLSDNIRLQFKNAPLYSEQDLQRCIDKCEVIDYHQTVEYKGIKFTPTAAGHVLGAAMFMIDIDSVRVLYTGDYSLEEDRHLIQASIPPGGPPDVLICESTFGVTNIPSREKRETDFTNTVESIVRRGGSCLIPVFALGRAQELLLILDEYWKANPDLQNVPLFYASKLATKSLRVYQTFINMMNNHIRDMMDTFHNPFRLKYIRSINNNEFEVMGPSVVMASPGFMQSGVSRQLFEAWCDSEKNGVIIAGYTIEGTLANDLLSFPNEIKCMDNRIKPRRCQIEYIAFSAHVDYQQNKSFIKSVMPDYIILVHGEKTQMKRLKEGLEHEIRKNWSTTHKPSIATPENGIKVKLRFRKTIIANVVGSAAAQMLANIDNAVSGPSGATAAGAPLPDQLILVTENFNSKLVQSSEVSNFTGCKFGRILQKVVIPIPEGMGFTGSPTGGAAAAPVRDSPADLKVTEALIHLMVDALEEVFDEISIHTSEKKIVVQDLVTVSAGYAAAPAAPQLSHILVEWLASPITDTAADCITSIILALFSTENALRLSLSSSTVKKRKPLSTHISKDNTSKSVKSEESELAQKIQSGKLDPSMAVASELSAEQRTVLTGRLQSLLQQILANESVSGFYDSVTLNAAGDRIILRGKPLIEYKVATRGSKVTTKNLTSAVAAERYNGGVCAEAFCYIAFDEQMVNHHAAVKCDDEAFAQVVRLTLQTIGGGSAEQ